MYEDDFDMLDIFLFEADEDIEDNTDDEVGVDDTTEGDEDPTANDEGDKPPEEADEPNVDDTDNNDTAEGDEETVPDEAEAPKASDENKKLKLYSEFENLLHSISLLQDFIVDITINIEDNNNKEKHYNILIDTLKDTTEKINIVLTETFNSTEYNSLMFLFLSFKTTLMTVSDIFKKMNKKEKK